MARCQTALGDCCFDQIPAVSKTLPPLRRSGASCDPPLTAAFTKIRQPRATTPRRLTLPLRNDFSTLYVAVVGPPRRAWFRSNAAQICGSHRTSAIDDLIAEPQQALVGAGSCFVGVGSVWHVIAAALLLFLKPSTDFGVDVRFRFDRRTLARRCGCKQSSGCSSVRN